jgi:hypothetical protein
MPKGKTNWENIDRLVQEEAEKIGKNIPYGVHVELWTLAMTSIRLWIAGEVAFRATGRKVKLTPSPYVTDDHDYVWTYDADNHIFMIHHSSAREINGYKGDPNYFRPIK